MLKTLISVNRSSPHSLCAVSFWSIFELGRRKFFEKIGVQAVYVVVLGARICANRHLTHSHLAPFAQAKHFLTFVNTY